ncbi:cytochrome P450 [Xylogone sp. PMI_703]|nr:cytochrome P450 [Xylogone sp. PMI_703]
MALIISQYISNTPAYLPPLGLVLIVIFSIHKWACQYGEIFRVRLGPITEYFITSDYAELFDRASAYTSERPRWIVSNEQICHKLNLLFLNASDPRWRNQRRAINSRLTSVSRADAGLPFLNFETAKFLHVIANNPEEGLSCKRIMRLIARYTYSAFATQNFAMDIPDVDDPVIDYIHGTFPGTHLVDIFTWLEHLPLWLKPWERTAKKMFQRDIKWVIECIERIKKSDFSGTYLSEAFLPSIIGTPDLGGFDSEEEPGYLALQMIIGAADTSQMSTWSFLEAMLLYPDVQKKACCWESLPEFCDLERIPYVRCLMKEVWGWRPPVSLGHPHVTTREIVFNGYRIPKGSRLHLNAYINSTDVRKRDHFALGAGRRVCPGYNIAERSLAIAIMRILWAFDVSLTPGAELPTDPTTYMTGAEMPGNATTKLPVVLTIRSPEKRQIINDAFEKLLRERPPVAKLA